MSFSPSIRNFARGGLFALAAFTVIAGAIAWRSVDKSQTSRQEVNSAIETLSLVQQADHAALAEFSALSGFYTLNDSSLFKLYLERRSEVEDYLAALYSETTGSDDRVSEFASSALVTHRSLVATVDMAMESFFAGQQESALAIVEHADFQTSATEFSLSFSAPMASLREKVTLLQERDASSQGLLIYSLGGLAACVLAFVVVGGLLMRRWIVRPLQATGIAARRIAEGELAVRVPDFGNTEIGLLGQDINLMATSLIRRSEELNAYLSLNLEARTVELEAANANLEVRTAELSRLSSILEATTDFVGVADPEGRALYINSGGLSMLGMPVNADVGGISIQSFHPDWAGQRIREEAIPNAVLNGSWQGESALLLADGTELPVSQVLLAHHDEHGGLAFLSTICRDLTETKELFEARVRAKEMEQAMKAQEHEQGKLASLADSMAAGLVMIGSDGAVSYSNNQVADVLNVSTTNFAGVDEQTLFAVLVQHAADSEVAASAFRELSNDCSAWRTRTIVFNSPSKTVMRCSMFPVRDAAGRDLGKGLLLSDVTREAEVEQMKDEFIDIASHELRTPLTGIMGFTELLRDGLPPGSLEREWAGRVNDEARRLAALVSDLLDASRIDSGSMEVHPEVFGLTDCLAQVAERAMSGYPERKVVLKTDERLSIEADQAKVIQVTTNLLDNALKYSPESEPVEIVQRLTGQAVEITVSDRGAGIPRDQVEHIFEKFYRLEAANPEIRGTGLGLYISRKLAERMGGEIAVRSQPAEGSSFILTLPLARPETQIVDERKHCIA